MMAAIIVLWSQGALLSNELVLRSETIFRGFQRDTDKEEDALVAPVYQYLSADYEDTDAGGWAFHIFGKGRKDLGDTGYFDEDPEVELVHGYVEYRRPYGTYQMKLGRQHLFSGVSDERLDGLWFETGLGASATISIFGGIPSYYDEDNGTGGDMLYGGRIAHHRSGLYEIGLSYQKIDDDGELASEKAGIDTSLDIGEWLALSGLSSYNLDTADWREHRYSATLRYNDVAFEPSYQHFRYQDYFGEGNSQNNLFHFLKGTDETVSIAGLDILWNGFDNVQLGLRGRSYAYALKEENAAYGAALAVFTSETGSQMGMEIGRMQGDSDDNAYSLYRLYGYLNDPFKSRLIDFISADVLLQQYDDPIFDEDSSLYVEVGGGKRFLEDRIQLKLSGIYSRDPYFDEDIGAIVTVNMDF